MSRIIERIMDSEEGIRVRILYPSVRGSTQVILERQDVKTKYWRGIQSVDLSLIEDYSGQEIKEFMHKICVLEIENRVLKEMLAKEK